jgi:toxin CcdB
LAQFDVRRNASRHRENMAVVLHPLEIVSMPAEQLGEFVGSLQDSGDAIAAALDELLTQAWR